MNALKKKPQQTPQRNHQPPNQPTKLIMKFGFFFFFFLVQSLFLFMNAISSAIQQGLTALSADPLLIWNYGFVTILAFVGGNLFYLAHRDLDTQEDELNRIQHSSFIGDPGRLARDEECLRLPLGNARYSERRYDSDSERGVDMGVEVGAGLYQYGSEGRGRKSGRGMC